MTYPGYCDTASGLQTTILFSAVSAPLREKYVFKPPTQADFPVIRKSTTTV
jgi:hypothetical protein